MKWETGTPCWLECRLVPFLRRLRIVIYVLIWAVLGPRCSSRVLSSCGRWGLLSGCRVQASRGGGFFCWEHSCSSCGLWAVAHRLSYFVARVESSWTRDQTHVPCTGRRTLSPWATREVPRLTNVIKLQKCIFPWINNFTSRYLFCLCTYRCTKWCIQKVIHWNNPWNRKKDGI